MSETVNSEELTKRLNTTSVSEALGLNGKHKIPGYVGHVPGKDDCVGIRYSEATRICLKEFDEKMAVTRSMTRTYMTGTNDLPTVPDEPQKVKLTTKIPGLDFFFFFLES